MSTPFVNLLIPQTLLDKSYLDAVESLTKTLLSPRDHHSVEKNDKVVEIDSPYPSSPSTPQDRLESEDNQFKIVAWDESDDGKDTHSDANSSTKIIKTTRDDSSNSDNNSESGGEEEKDDVEYNVIAVAPSLTVPRTVHDVTDKSQLQNMKMSELRTFCKKNKLKLAARKKTQLVHLIYQHISNL